MVASDRLPVKRKNRPHTCIVPTKQKILIGGIDPGLASGGFVVIDKKDRERVLLAASLVISAQESKAVREEAHKLAAKMEGWSDVEFLIADLKARLWMNRFTTVLDEFEKEYGEIDIFGMESFVDQRQHAKKMMKNRWHAPLLMGHLAAELDLRGVNPSNGRLIYQNAGIVLTQLKDERQQLKNRTKSRTSKKIDLIVPGDHQVTNDHQRSALSHAIALSIRLPSNFSLKTTT